MPRRSVTPDQLPAEIRRIEQEIAKKHREAMAELVEHAVDMCVLGSPVDTGAYKASHTVNLGLSGSGPGPVIYEGPDRVGDDEIVPDFPKDRYTPASGRDAKQDVLKQRPYLSLMVRNGRYYAQKVEYGLGYLVYTKAWASVAAMAQLLANDRSRIE